MKPLTNHEKIAIGMLVAILLFQVVRSHVPTVLAPSAATAAVYVYEKSDGAVPLPVLSALNTINRSGIAATVFDDDTTDSSGDTPEQYKLPLVSAKEAGLPALVVMAGEKVRKVVKAPTTEAAVLEAVK